MPATRAASLRSTVEAVVREQHHQLRAVLARLVDLTAHLLLANAERPFRHHPARIGDRRIGERFVRARQSSRPPCRTVFIAGNTGSFHSVSRILSARNGIAQRLDQLLHPRFAIGEFPVAGHGVGPQAASRSRRCPGRGSIGAERALPGVAAVEQQHAVLAALSAHALDHGGHAGRARRCGRRFSPAPQNPPRSGRTPRRIAPGCRSVWRKSLPVRCGGRPLASPTPRLIDGSRK